MDIVVYVDQTLPVKVHAFNKPVLQRHMSTMTNTDTPLSHIYIQLVKESSQLIKYRDCTTLNGFALYTYVCVYIHTYIQKRQHIFILYASSSFS